MWGSVRLECEWRCTGGGEGSVRVEEVWGECEGIGGVGGV